MPGQRVSIAAPVLGFHITALPNRLHAQRIHVVGNTQQLPGSMNLHHDDNDEDDDDDGLVEAEPPPQSPPASL